jgi:hypothetical protein
MANEINARGLLEVLAGREIATATGRPNTILLLWLEIIAARSTGKRIGV